jgi:AraC-like DNA-binding protein
MVALEPTPPAARAAAFRAAVHPTTTARWELTGSRIESVAAGAAVHLPGPSAWLLVLDGELVVESWQSTEVLSTHDAAFLGRAHAYRTTATRSARVALAAVRQAGGEPPVPELFVARGFATASRGVAALVELCPLAMERHAGTSFAASYGELLAAAMRTQWLDSLDEPVDVATDLAPELHRVVAAVSRDPAHPWTLQELARLAHLSRSSLGERFREALATTPLQLVREARMRRARELLADADHSVTHVAFAVGYGSVAAFSRAFTAVHGTTPRGWRAGSCRSSAEAGEPDGPDDREARARQEHRRQTCAVEQPAA